ncbi:MAG TPA: ZIP family metal transporter [Actinomycetota bacterium]|nr:ZIP family metal transporter [Actinomycetota bacterium]
MATRTARFPNWLVALVPVIVIAALALLFARVNPIGALRAPPPVETIAFERTVLDPNMITLRLRNDGPDPVTIAQVLVDDAYWDHTIGDRTLGRLESTSLRIPYPWEEGLPLAIALVTETGVTIEHEIEAATLTPDVDRTTLGIYALLGLYIGVIPVAVGLLWFGPLKRASDRWVAFFLAFTVGLLAFLLVDTVAEGLELAGEAAAVLDGVGLFAIGVVVAVLVLTWLSGYLDSKRGMASGLVLAYLIAAGVGLHNLGEGLAVGAALAAGEIALGTFLVVGFALHNTTEGLAIVAPLGRERSRPPIGHLLALGAIAGVPTILGAWGGGFAFFPAPAALAFGLAAGAIAQVVWVIARSLPGERGLASGAGTLGFIAGLMVMYATGLFTA